MRDFLPLLIALWVRSYWLCDIVFKDDTKGGYRISLFNGNLLGRLVHLWWRQRRDTNGPSRVLPTLRRSRQGGFVTSPGSISIPIWVGALLIGIITALARIEWSKRFSLRTLLVATTLVAVVLGLAVAFR